MKRVKKIIATVLVATLMLQCLAKGEDVRAVSSNYTEVVYSDGIQFEVIENEDDICLIGEYNGQRIEIVQNREDDETAEAIISTGLFSENDYLLEISNKANDIDNIDIDALYDSDTIEETVERIDSQSLIENSEVSVYDEKDNLVDIIELDKYEGQACIAAAGTASYYLLSAAVSALITYKAVTVYQSTTKKKSGKVRHEGIPINKNKVPNRKNRNKVVKGTSLPIDGEPKNSSTDLINSNTGKLCQRRFYDENGEACLDVDFSHGGNHTFPHIHFWN